MAEDQVDALKKRVEKLKMNMKRARAKTAGLMAAFVITANVVSKADPSLKVEIMDRLQKGADSHQTSGYLLLADAINGLLEQM